MATISGSTPSTASITLTRAVEERSRVDQLEKEIRTLRQQLNRFSAINPEEYARLQEAAAHACRAAVRQTRPALGHLRGAAGGLLQPGHRQGRPLGCGNCHSCGEDRVNAEARG
jgi:hypothetical protein